MKRIYHGSADLIKHPEYGFGKPYNDYGLGFYCTESMDMAKEWSVDLDRDGFANIYDIDMRGLSVLNINSEQYTILHWLTVLLQNREFDMPAALAREAKQYLIENFNVDYNEADIIIGYRADDSYFSFAQDFLNGTISYRQLCRAMKLGNLGLQFVIKSEKAFFKLKYIGCELAHNDMWYPKKKYRDDAARTEYFNVDRNKIRDDDLFILDIIREEIEKDDSRLR